MANKIPLAVADFETQLSTGLDVGGTSFSITSATDDDGNSLPAGKYCFTVDNGKSNKEYLLGQLNGTDVTSVVRVSRQGVETSGTAFAHRVGANVVITDFATIQRVADILRGQVDLDGSNPVGYDAEPTLADRKDLATVGYVLDTVTGGTVAFDTQTVTGNAGATLVAGELIYFKTSDQEWYKTDADTASTVEGVLLGIALGAGTDGAGITNGVLVQGIYTTSGLTAGSEYYASNTAGAYSTSAGTTARKIGIALSTTKLMLYPSNPQTVTTREKAGIVPIGTIFPYAGATAPTNYLLCYGQAISRTTYADLFAILSTTYGVGDGSSTFNLPDLRGRVIAALDNLGGSSANVVTDADADTLGGIDGEEDHTLTIPEMPSHSHGGGVFNYNSPGGTVDTSAYNGGTNDAYYVGSTGGGTAHNTMQPTIFMSYIIRAL